MITVFDFEHKWNSIWLRKSKGKLSPRSYPIQFEWKWNTSFLSVKKIPVRSVACNYASNGRTQFANIFGVKYFNYTLFSYGGIM